MYGGAGPTYFTQTYYSDSGPQRAHPSTYRAYSSVNFAHTVITGIVYGGPCCSYNSPTFATGNDSGIREAFANSSFSNAYSIRVGGGMGVNEGDAFAASLGFAMSPDGGTIWTAGYGYETTTGNGYANTSRGIVTKFTNNWATMNNSRVQWQSAFYAASNQPTMYTMGDKGSNSVADSSGNLFVPFRADDNRVAKIDSSGYMSWYKRFNFTGTLSFRNLNAFDLDSSGNLYMVGTVIDSSVSGGNAGPTGKWKIFLTKLNTSGAVQWSRSFYTGSTPTSDGRGFNSANMYVKDDYVYVSGISYRGSEQYYLCVIKYPTNGAISGTTTNLTVLTETGASTVWEFKCDAITTTTTDLTGPTQVFKNAPAISMPLWNYNLVDVPTANEANVSFLSAPYNVATRYVGSF